MCRYRAARAAKKPTFSAKSDIFSPKYTDVWRVTDLGFTSKQKSYRYYSKFCAIAMMQNSCIRITL